MANEKRLIDANAFIKSLEWECGDVCEQTEYSDYLECEYGFSRDAIRQLVQKFPTVDAVEVVHGRWIHVPSSDMMTGKAYKCSECNKMRYGSYMPNYCQCCGAKMDGGDKDD